MNKKQLRLFLLGTLLGSVATAAAIYLPGVDWDEKTRIIETAARPGPDNEVSAYLTERARRLHLTYEEVLAAPAHHEGDPVLWDIKIFKSTGTASFVNEDHRLPVIWTRPDVSPLCPASGHQTYTVLAIVKKVKKDVIQLEYLGCS